MVTLKNGTFYNDGVKIPLEFGNKDQIKLLEKSEALMSVDGVVASIDESVVQTAIAYTCLCGHNFRREYSHYEWNELQSDKFTCEGCGLKYKLDVESFHPLVKFDGKQK